MTGYDCLAINYVRHNLFYSKKALVGIICSGISNSLGFALVSSCVIRYRFYSHWGLSVISIAQISAFCKAIFVLKFFAIGAIIFLTNPVVVPYSLNLYFVSLQPLVAIFFPDFGLFINNNYL